MGKIFYYQPIIKPLAKNGSERLGVNLITKFKKENETLAIELTQFGKTLKEAWDKFNKFFTGAIELPCNYYLCSKAIIDQFKPFEVSKPFNSGWDFEKNKEYYVAWLNFTEVDKYYKEIIEPSNEQEKEPMVDFWCRECVSGSMDVSKITIAGAKKNGLMVEIENKLNLTTERNQALIIYNLSQKYNCTPVEFINKIVN